MRKGNIVAGWKSTERLLRFAQTECAKRTAIFGIFAEPFRKSVTWATKFFICQNGLCIWRRAKDDHPRRSVDRQDSVTIYWTVELRRGSVLTRSASTGHHHLTTSAAQTQAHHTSAMILPRLYDANDTTKGHIPIAIRVRFDKHAMFNARSQTDGIA